MTDAERDEERERRDLVRCPTCGVPWVEHSQECSRHDYRPGWVWEKERRRALTFFEVLTERGSTGVKELQAGRDGKAVCP